MNRAFLAVCIFLASTAYASASATDTLDFESEEQRLQFMRLTEELRCPKCQNQNIADSNAPIANDLRAEVYRMLIEGKNDEQVVDFMVERYGNFVMYEPKFDRSTYLLWLGPALIALLGVFIVLRSSRRKKAAEAVREVELSKEEKSALSKILSEDEK